MLIHNFLLEQSIKLSILSLLIFGVSIHYEIFNNQLFTIFFFITSSIFSIYLLLRFSNQKKNISIINFFLFFVIFYNLYFYFFYLIYNSTYFFFEGPPIENFNFNLSTPFLPSSYAEWEKLYNSSFRDVICFKRHSCYFSFISNINTVNLVLYLNFIFFFFIIIFINYFSKDSHKFNFEKFENKYSLKNILFVFFSLFIFNYLNDNFFENKTINFIITDSIKLMIIFILFYLANIIPGNSKNKLSIFLLILILYFIISISYDMSINTDPERTQIYGLQSAPDFMHWINSNLSRSMIYTGSVVFTFFFLLSKYYNYELQYKLFLISIIIGIFLPTIIFYNLSSFHVLSEIQINRNVSMIIEGIDRNYLRYENLDYLKKLIQDIVPFTGRERGYSILLTEVYDIFNLNSGNSKYNSGIITESFLFFGVIGVIFVAFLFSIIIILINFLFSVLKKDLFFIFCYCHLLSQIYWLYRGGMVLFIRKIYFFSAVYLLLFLMFFLGKFLFQKRGS